MFDSPQVAFIIQIVRQASRLVRRVQQELASPAMTKNDRSPVTVGDFAAQAVVAHKLSQMFPDDALVGEENAAALLSDEGHATLEQVTRFVAADLGDIGPGAVCQLINRGNADGGSRFWTLDPIDGTKGFLRGDQYAVAFALIENGVVQLGALGCPHLQPSGVPDMQGGGTIFVAARGEGTWAATLADDDTNFVRVRVSDCQELSPARLLRSVEAGHTDESKIDELAARLGIQCDPVRMDSQAKYAVLAAGGGEILLRLLSPARPDYREKIWDQAAGAIVIEEAGGRVTDLDGRALDFSHGRSLLKNRGVFASNARLHDAVLDGLKQIGA